MTVLLTVFRIMLAQKTPLIMQGDATLDDFLMVYYAGNLLQGNWLGAFSNLVCAKGISYPLFLAGVYLSGLQYQLALILFNIVAIAFFLFAVRTWIKNKYLYLLIFLFLVFSPVTFASQISGVVYRDAILTPTLLIVLGCMFGLFIHRGEPLRKMVPWSVGLGVSFSYFWFIREDTYWLLPFVCAMLLMTGIAIWRGKDRRLLPRASLLVLPLVMLAVSYVGIGLVNYHEYGLFMVNDRTGTSFSDVFSDLISIDDGDDDTQVIWVTRDMLDLACSQSPTLDSISDELDASLELWGTTDTGLPGDITAWALRTAASDAGYYSDATTMENFYAQVHEELQAAFDSGALQQRSAFYVSSSARGMTADDVPLLEENFTEGFAHIIDYGYYDMDPLTSTGPFQYIRIMETMTNSLAIYPDSVVNQIDDVGVAQYGLSTVGNVASAVLGKVATLYKVTGYVLFGLGTLGYVLLFIESIRDMRHRRFGNLVFFLIITGLLLSILVLLFGVTWFTSWMAPTYQSNIYYYTSAGVTLMQLCECAGIIHLVRTIKAAVERKKAKDGTYRP